jgi:hypothetical protein
LRTTDSLQGDIHSAETTLLCCGRGGRRRWAPESVDLLHEQENSERDNEEVNDRVDEVSVRNYRYTGLLGLIKTLVSASAEDNKEVLEVEASHYFSDGRHDDIAHKRCHDGSERGADDDADCEIENIAAHREFFELFEHGVPPRMNFGVMPSKI